MADSSESRDRFEGGPPIALAIAIGSEDSELPIDSTLLTPPEETPKLESKEGTAQETPDLELEEGTAKVTPEVTPNEGTPEKNPKEIREPSQKTPEETPISQSEKESDQENPEVTSNQGSLKENPAESTEPPQKTPEETPKLAPNDEITPEESPKVIDKTLVRTSEETPELTPNKEPSEETPEAPAVIEFSQEAPEVASKSSERATEETPKGPTEPVEHSETPKASEPDDEMWFKKKVSEPAAETPATPDVKIEATPEPTEKNEHHGVLRLISLDTPIPSTEDENVKLTSITFTERRLSEVRPKSDSNLDMPRDNSSSSLMPPPRPLRKMSTITLASNASQMSAPPRRRGNLVFNTLPRNARPPTREEAKKKKTRSMFSWLGGDSSKKKNKEVLESVSEGLRKIYKQKLFPLEDYYKFHDFHSPALDDPDFDAKPMILLVGQYSTGKTTFIRYLLESDFPGIRIGPEPTTDRFIAVMHGDEEGIVPGNALVVDAKKQFRALSGFGNAFLNRFQCSTLNNQVLESVTIVDTPGILSGEKQRIDRGYDFTGVLEWFAERVDRIILLFDAHKLDISDEFKRCIEALAGNEDKIRIVLNKSDMVDHQQLMRVYGALMWSLGKVFKTPEVSRVYLGSFWDHPLHYDINRRLFQDEQHDLFQDLQALPRNAALRKLNDLIKRARLAKVHAFIIAELRKQMPSMIGKDKKKKELIQNLDKIFEQLQREHNISPGDFPDVNKMREKLQNQDFTKFNPIKPKLLEVVDGMLATDIARLMAQIPKEEAVAATNGTAGTVTEQPTVKGGAFSQAVEAETPFGFGRYGNSWGEGFDKGADESEWVVSRERKSADSTFDSLGPVGGFVSGRAAKEHMVKSKLPNSVLGKIWKLADVDKDGQLDADEFALANYLINLKLEGHELPIDLPKHLIPPSKRAQETVYPTLGDDE